MLQLLFLFKIKFKILKAYLTVTENTILDSIDIVVDRLVKGLCTVVNVDGAP